MKRRVVALSKKAAKEIIEEFPADPKRASPESMPVVERKPRGHGKLDHELALRIATASFRGASNPDIAKAVGVSLPTVSRYRRHPDFDKACADARAALSATSTNALHVARVDAIEVASAILSAARRGDQVDQRTVGEAMRIVVAASAPTPERYKVMARRDLINSLSPNLKKMVMDELAGVDSEVFEGMSDEDLDALCE